MSHQVNWPVPLTRLNPWYPGQMGVPGTDVRTGLRNTVEGAVFYVDPNFTGVSDLRDGTNPDDPLATVAAALTKCLPYRGDTIAVMAANTYEYGNGALGRLVTIDEAVVANVPGVRIVGVAPSNALGVTWTPPANADVCIRVTAPDVLIEGFSFYTPHANNTAIYCQWSGVTTFGDATVIRNCYFDHAFLYGIVLEFAYHTQIYQNEFRCEAGGGCIWTDVAFSACDLLNIYLNKFHTEGAAIFLPELADSQIYQNSLFNALAAAAGAATNLGINLTGGADNEVHDNWLSCALPIVAPGDYADFNTAGAGDAWINNHCMNGDAITNP